MTGEVFNVILPLAKRVSDWFLSNTHTFRLGALVVGIGICNANGDGVSDAERRVGLVCAEFSHDDGSIADVELHAMISDAQAHGESECIAQPSGSLIYIRIGQYGNDGSARNRSIGEHSFLRHYARFRSGLPRSAQHIRPKKSHNCQ